MIIYLRDFDSIILGQAWEYVSEQVGIVGLWFWATYCIQTTVGGTLPRCTMHQEGAVLLLKTLQGLLAIYVKARGDKK